MGRIILNGYEYSSHTDYRSTYGSQKPLHLDLKFSSPLAYLAADTIGELDYLLRQIYTFRYLSIFQESYKIANPLYRKLKTVLAQSRQWRYIGVTRKDFYEKNQKAQGAEAILGKVPSFILKASL